MGNRGGGTDLKLEPVGGIFWRLDSSGNLTAYDTAGNELGKFVGGLFSSTNNASRAVVIATGTTSATFVSTGEGVTITPRVSGSVLILFVAALRSGVAGDDAELGIYRNTTGTIPADGAAPNGSLVEISRMVRCLRINVAWNGIVFDTDTGLTLGTAYTYHCAYRRDAGTGTIVIDNGLLHVTEI